MTDWSLGVRQEAPDTAVASITAGIRLDDALRLYLTEQGAKRVRKEDLWSLVMGTMRLRLTANSVAGLRSQAGPGRAAGPSQADPLQAMLRRRAAGLADFYGRVADQVGPPRHDQLAPVVVPDLRGLDGLDGLSGLDGPNGAGRGEAATAHYHPRALWVREHLHHLGEHAQAITAPAEHVAELRRVPWWR